MALMFDFLLLPSRGARGVLPRPAGGLGHTREVEDGMGVWPAFRTEASKIHRPTAAYPELCSRARCRSQSLTGGLNA
jgi:hypothetical protein